MSKRAFAFTLALIACAGAGRAEVDPTLLAGMKARSIGPAGMSGRVAAIDAWEADPNLVYVGAATGGVWKSENGGLTWKPVFDDQKVAAVGAVTLDQSNPSIVWVGTGEGNVRNSASVGNGVYRSLDGGESWQHLGLDGSERIHRIVLHPGNSETVWVAAMGREWGENPERGVFKSSDGGKSWRKVLYVDERTGCAELVLDPSNPNKLFAAMWEYRRWPHFFKSGGPGSGLYVSQDGGESWRRLQEEDGLPAGELGRIGVAIARSRPSVVYALVEAKKSALLRSEDGGRSFRVVNEEPNVNPRPFYYADLRVDPQNPNRVYSVDYVIRGSTDGGKSFAPAISWDQLHGDYHALWIDPADPDHFYVGNDGGVGVSYDGGKTNRFVTNLALAQFYHVAVDNERPYNVYGGLQDNSSWRGPSAVWQRGGIRSHEWRMVGNGDGFDVQPDRDDARIGYSLWQGGNLMRFNLATGEVKEIKPAATGEVPLRFNWNAALAVDPHRAKTIYLGSQFVHRSTDRGESWTTISSDLTTNNPDWQKQAASGGLTPDVTAAENYTTLVTLEPSPLDPGLLWAGSDDGRLHLTRDGGQSWQSLEKNVKGVPANTWIPQIRASRHRAGTAFVVFDDHRRSNWTPYLFRTDDFGATWTSLATPNLWGYALAIEQDPVDPDLLFLGTEFGLWVSLDAGKSWFQWKHGVPTVSVMDLVVHPREHDLVLGTHGRAIYILDDVRPLRELAAETLKKPLHLFAPPPAQQFWQASEPGGWRLGATEYRGENRPYGALLTFALAGDDLPLPDREAERARKEKERRARAAAPAGEGEAAKSGKKPEEKVTIEIADAAGKVVRTLRFKPQRGVQRVVWDFGRDAFAQPPSDGRRRRGGDEENPSGPEVPPGDYRVTVRFRGAEASQSLSVLADPRVAWTAADWQARWRAIEAAGGEWERAVAAVKRVRQTRDDLEEIAKRARAREEEAIRRGKVRADELPLVAAGEKVKKALTEIEKRLWQAPETVGIVERTAALADLGTAMGYLTGSWDPPSANHLVHLERAKVELAQVLGDLEKFYAGDLADYRRQVEAAGIGLLPAAGR